jgi:hypothetical protein
MKKRNLKLFITLLAVVLIAGGSIFYACNKVEDLKETILQNDETDNPAKAGIKVLTVEVSEKGLHGEGHGQNKECVLGPKRCWLWHWFSGPVRGPINSNFTIAVVENNDVSSSSAKPVINLNFKYEYNNRTKLESQDMFDLENSLFVLEEDIVEEIDGDLLRFMGTNSSCIIPAGTYPIIIYSDGIKVMLPIIIQ